MDAKSQKLRSIFGYRVLTLGAVAFMLPPLVPLTVNQLARLLGLTICLLLFWNAPFWQDSNRGLGLPLCALVLEGMLISALAFGFGGAASPMVLLLLPALAQASMRLPTRHFACAATAILSSYGVLVAREMAGTRPPIWLPLWGAALVLTAVWMGVGAHLSRRTSVRTPYAAGIAKRYRALVEHLSALAARPKNRQSELEFWRGFLVEMLHGTGFSGAAVIRWDGLRPEVVTLDREAAWSGLVGRHPAVFRAASRASGPQVFAEETSSIGRSRVIICWPIPSQLGQASGLLCVLAPARLDAAVAQKRLARYFPIAAVALALSMPRLALHRQQVDWQVLIDATLHRLHGRLARYLVLVHVDQGSVEADPLLLADAIAHVIEEVLDRTPPMTPVRLSVHQDADGWRLNVETEHSPLPDHEHPRPGILLAKQVIGAHGGAWEQINEGASPYRVGFLLPARAEAQRPVSKNSQAG
jgi:hypothetical protein